MASPVALPIRFGSKRFGRVTGGVLATDSKDYPQPQGDRPWQKGMATLLAPTEADPNAETYGYRPNALLSGGRFDLYGKPLDGWVCCDSHGLRWLIKPTFPSVNLSTDAITINYSIVRFGLFGSSVTFVPTTGTLSLDDIGMNSFTLPFTGNGLGGGRTSVTWTWYGTDAAYLVSTNSDGTKAIVLLAADSHGYWSVNNDLLGVLGLDRYPMGYLEITATSAEDPGNPPTLSVAVLRTLQQTVGAPACNVTFTGTGYSSADLCDPTSCVVDYRNATVNTATGGITGILAALFYENDILTEMTVGLSYVAESEVVAPTIGETTIEQDSTYENVITATVSCGGRTLTATITDTHTVNVLGTCNCSGGFGQAITSSHNWAYEADDGTTLSWGWTDEEDTLTGVLTLFTATSAASCLMLTDVYHWYPDDCIYRLGYYADYSTDAGALVPLWRRYAYNVIGLQLVHVLDSGDDDFQIHHIDNALSPAAKVLSSGFPSWSATDLTAKYGAYNPRTAEAVACQAAATCYV